MSGDVLISTFGKHGGRKRAETPVDDNNHALAALRYMISQQDAGKLGRWDRKEAGSPDQALKVEAAQKKWMSWRNEALWRVLS
jgi:hypothetical protein